MIAPNIKHTKFSSEWTEEIQKQSYILDGTETDPTKQKSKQLENLFTERTKIDKENTEITKEIRKLRSKQKSLSLAAAYHLQAQKEYNRLNDGASRSTHNPREKNFLGTGVGTKYRTNGWLKNAENHFKPASGTSVSGAKLDNLYKVKIAGNEVETTEEQAIQLIARVVKTLQGEGDWETKTAQTITDLEQEVQDLTHQLNSILNKWNWGGWKPKSATEFLNKFEPWINQHLESAEKLKTTEQQLVDSQKEVEHLKTERETSEELENLESERDEAIREKRTLEQETVSLSNKLKLKSQETDNKVKEIERLKKEKGASEIALNRTITELREQHRKREKLLDEEQTENNKLTTENEKLTTAIAELKRSQSPTMPGNWDYEDEVSAKQEELQTELKAKEEQISELTKTQQEQLRNIFALFDLRAKGMKEIDFNQLYSLLNKVKDQQKSKLPDDWSLVENLEKELKGKLVEKDRQINNLEKQLAESARERERAKRK